MNQPADNQETREKLLGTSMAEAARLSEQRLRILFYANTGGVSLIVGLIFPSSLNVLWASAATCFALGLFGVVGTAMLNANIAATYGRAVQSSLSFWPSKWQFDGLAKKHTLLQNGMPFIGTVPVIGFYIGLFLSITALWVAVLNPA